MPTLRRAALFAASGAAAAALVAGCGSSGSSHSSGAATTTPAAPTAPSTVPATPATPSTPAAPAGQTVLRTATSGTLGTIVTDGSGFTLYRFDQDTAQPSMSNCNGACATLWPPEKAAGTPQLKGIDAKLVGTVTRSDGSKQVTLNGWPLYRYSPDTKPGDTKGQGFGGIWFAATPTGGKAGAVTQPPATTPGTTTPKPTSPSPTMNPGSGGGGGYGY
ncbi:hypothetical protein [Kitasatospora sp. MAP5-34]|uniref:hypothetical protein n=1 Tax=Kitasatospora sp. MAP5-34 TaxID=3035102 RepID=UPI002475E713|nr:hypothetical protein [Kitasatospora sp. MAP5-34]MDH6576113.1 putative lipoprotein with Yx(FWY)xxD motif [Kitasatospora sp. MAP5-34]